MRINQKLFDECFCPCEGIGRVCLRGDGDIPTELVEIAKEIDKDDYTSSGFSVDVFAGGALICYMGEHEFKELLVCDNYDEVLAYYMNNASNDDLKATFSAWENN